MTAPTELAAGRIVGLFGLRGECKLDASRIGTDSLGGVTTLAATLADGSRRTLRIVAQRRHGGRPLLRFDGYDDATSAEVLVGATLFLARADVHVGPGEYLDVDLLGCRVVDAHGVERGSVSAVEHYPAQDMLVVGAAKTLVPMVRAVVTAIDLEQKCIRVDAPLGLFDERDALADDASGVP